jgi:hypothetical protein
MKQRLPRKAKKSAKKKLKLLTGMRMAQTAVVALNARFQVMNIISTPFHNKASKAIEIANVTVNTAQTVSKILSEKPNHWKDFLKPVC